MVLGFFNFCCCTSGAWVPFCKWQVHSDFVIFIFGEHLFSLSFANCKYLTIPTKSVGEMSKFYISYKFVSFEVFGRSNSLYYHMGSFVFCVEKKILLIISKRFLDYFLIYQFYIVFLVLCQIHFSRLVSNTLVCVMSKFTSFFNFCISV